MPFIYNIFGIHETIVVRSYDVILPTKPMETPFCEIWNKIPYIYHYTKM